MSEPTTTGPTVAVEAPDVPTPRGGLLDVAPITSVTEHMAAGPVEYVGAPCGPAGLAPGMCCSAVTTDEIKTFDFPPTWCGGPYAVYKAVGCDILGEPYDDMARAALERGEGFAVEKAFREEHLAGATVLADGVCAAEGIGILEQYAGENYAGRPVFHTNRYGAVVLGSKDVVFPGMDSPLTTILGTPVAASAGLGDTGPDGTDAAPGEFWVYGTGHVHLYQSPIVASQGRDVETNQSIALAERIWSATVECFSVAVRIVTECSS